MDYDLSEKICKKTWNAIKLHAMFFFVIYYNI